jgi:hypothetical protein
MKYSVLCLQFGLKQPTSILVTVVQRWPRSRWGTSGKLTSHPPLKPSQVRAALHFPSTARYSNERAAPYGSPKLQFGMTNTTRSRLLSKFPLKHEDLGVAEYHYCVPYHHTLLRKCGGTDDQKTRCLGQRSERILFPFDGRSHRSPRRLSASTTVSNRSAKRAFFSVRPMRPDGVNTTTSANGELPARRRNIRAIRHNTAAGSGNCQVGVLMMWS